MIALAVATVLAAAPVAGFSLPPVVAVTPAPTPALTPAPTPAPTPALTPALTPAPTPAPTQAPQARPERAVLVGIPGLRWGDVSPEQTPTLWLLAQEGSLAALSVRTVRPTSCPADGWLTLNSGARSIAPRQGTGDDQRCVPPSDPAGDPARGYVVPGWSGVLSANREFSYHPRFGLLGRGAARRGCASAVGPGAALALADESGRVQRYTPKAADADLKACPLTVIDLGALREPYTPRRETQVNRLDIELSRVVADLPQDTTLFVAGLGDSVLRSGHLSVMVARGGPDGGGWLTARSTRHDGLVQITDLTPTLLATVGVPAPPGAVGSVMHGIGGRPDLAEAVADLKGLDRAAQVIRENFNPFFWALAFGQVGAYALLVLAGRANPGHRRRWLGAAEGVALCFAAAPVASFLANLLPWWRADHPGLTLWSTVGVGAVLVGALAFLLPWRPRLIGPAGFVAAATAIVLGLDVVLGSRLQLSSLYGLSPLIAGRFYGFGNIAFAVFAMSALLAGTWAAAGLRHGGWPAAAALAVALIGSAAVIIDGWPAFGADFGGVLALVPGFALLAFGVAGVRLSAWRAAAVGAGAVVTVSAIALLDWRRPGAERSHLGRFVQQIIDGDAGAVITRKIEANLGSLGQRPELVLLVPVALVVVTAIMLWPERLGVRGLVRAYDEEPVLRPGLVACLVTAVIGFAVNDSGVIVPAVALAVAAPQGVAMWAAAARRR